MPSGLRALNIRFAFDNMKVLYITRSPPYPLTIGGNQRTALLYRALARHGDVDLFLAVDEKDLPAPHLAEIRQNYRLVGLVAPAQRGELGVWRFLRPAAPRWIDRIADYLASRRQDYRPDPALAPVLKRLMADNPYDVVVGERLDLAMKTDITPDFPFLLDVNDVEQEWFQSQIDNPYSGLAARWVAAWRFSQLRKCVPDLYRRFSCQWVIKGRDVAFPGLENAKLLGMPYYPPKEGLPPLAPSDPASRVVMLLGSYYHRPNAEGLDWFIRQAWPLVRADVPDAEFHVIGPGLSVRRTEAISRTPGVRVLGTVPSVAPHYRECAFSIAPIWSGAGINIKVLESYAYGRACVVTPFAYRGYEDCLEKGTSVMVAKTAVDYARTCSTLLRDPALRDRLATAGYPQVKRNFSFERFAKAVDETFRAL